MEGIGVWDVLAVLLSACIGAMGLGGGGVLILYLTLVKNMPQLASQGVNLLFFLPCAVTAVIIYARRGLLRWKTVLPMAAGGALGVGAGSLFLQNVSSRALTVGFACLMIAAGLFTVFRREKVQ